MALKKNKRREVRTLTIVGDYRHDKVYDLMEVLRTTFKKDTTINWKFIVTDNLEPTCLTEGLIIINYPVRKAYASQFKRLIGKREYTPLWLGKEDPRITGKCVVIENLMHIELQQVYTVVTNKKKRT